MRRRRNRATWFPVVPTEYGEGIQVTWYEGQLTIVNPPEPGETTWQAIPLTFDNSGDQQKNFTASLRDKVEGSDYVLERVVGSVWMSNQFIESQAYEGIGCIALAVLPSDEEGSPALPPKEYDPLNADNAQQPWIWRRTWRLNSPDVWADAPPPGAIPISTAGYTGLEGGHVDTRGSRRRITKEHRLFIIAAHSIITEGRADTNTPIDWGYDLRLIGSMRKARNQSSF